ncbi:hypothetical protein DFH09DRAFT_1168984 [Mycena vulgaris]|nr:hypothetical protein DFH09DRAFT_1168984 [Mycena vulgaris]
MLNAIFTVLFIALWTPLSGVVAQCPQTAGYLGAFDSFSGAFIGAVSRNFPVPAVIPGAFTLDRTGNPSNYLAVIAYTNSTSEGDALLQILNPGDPNVTFLSLVGVLDCNTAAFPNFVNPSAILAPSDGFPHGALPTPGLGRTTYMGGYGNIFSWCGEPMAFLPPYGVCQHSLFMVQDLTHNYLAATPDPDIYASSNGGVVVEDVNLAIFL